MTSKYILYCITEQSAVFTWADEAPTTCPNDSGHEINPDSIYERCTATSYITSVICKSSSLPEYYSLAQMTWPGDTAGGNIVGVEIVTSSILSAPVYGVRITENLKSSVICEAEFTNSEPTIQSLGTILLQPYGRCILSIDVINRSEDTKTENAITVNDIIIYTDLNC